jgi:hypothetical protein
MGQSCKVVRDKLRKQDDAAKERLDAAAAAIAGAATLHEHPVNFLGKLNSDKTFGMI